MKPISILKNLQKSEGGKGICGGPLLSVLSRVPKFVGMAWSLIGNIWAAAATWRLAHSSEQKELVQKICDWENASEKEKHLVKRAQCHACTFLLKGMQQKCSV